MDDATRTLPADPITASVAYSTAKSAGNEADDATAVPVPPGYELHEKIGHGGMGVVYRGRDLELNREVAVKLLLAKYAPDSAAASRFLNEAQITGQLQHPGIPPVYRAGTLPDGHPFLSMKLIKGQTLHDLLKTRPDPAAERGRFVAVFEQICQAVGYAHTHRVIHRDLKPQNVMVGAFGEVFVMDWGLAKVLTEAAVVAATGSEVVPSTEIQSLRGDDSATQAGSLLGTPPFMPPEQAIGAIDEVDAQSDVFGLGAILCVILTGQPPYTGLDAEAVRKAAIRADQDAALARLAECGAEPEWIALCRRCLNPKKTDRPRDAGEVAEAVAMLRADTEERARRAELDRIRADADRRSAAVKAIAEQKKRRAQLALAGVAMLLVALTGAGAWWGQKQIDDRARLESDRAAERALAEAERTARRDRVRINARDAIERAAAFRGQWLWDQADKLLAQAAEPIEPDDDPDLAAEVATARRDTQFLARLFDIRMAKAGVDGKYHNEDAPPAYTKAFLDYGYDILNGDPDDLAKRLKASPVWSELLVALDDWAWTASIVAGQQDQGEKIWALTTIATGRANRPGRQATDLNDSHAVLQYVESIPSDELTPALVSFLSTRMEQLGGDKASVFEVGIRRHPTDFWMHFELGWAYWYAKPKRLDLALGAFRTSVALRPNVPSAQAFLTAASAERGTRAGQSPESDAIAALRERVKANPDDLAVRKQLGLALFYIKHDYPAAAEVFQELTRLQPEVADNHHRLGDSLSWASRFPEALVAHRAAFEIAPDNPTYLAHYGVALSRAGNQPEAIQLLVRAIDHPTDPQKFAYSHLGNAYEAAGQLPEAVAAYRNATRYFALNVFDWRRLSELAYKAEDFKTAAEAAREAMRLQPSDSFNHYRLAVALDALGDAAGAAAEHRKDGALCRSEKRYAHAINAFQRALALTPTDPALHHDIALTQLDRNDLTAADAAAQEALRLDPNLAAAHALRGDIARRERRFADALTAYQSAVRLAPDDLGYRHARAAAFHNLGRIEDAEAGYREVLRRNPDREQTLLNLANLLRIKGDLEGAIAAIREVIRVNPKQLVVYQNLAFLYRANGRLPEAVAAARRGVELFPNDSRAAQNRQYYEKLLATEHNLSAHLARTKVIAPADILAYANHCLEARPGKFALAYRLYDELPDLKYPNFYNAACAAVLFAAGRDPSCPDVSLDEWYFLMERSRKWLAADLAELKTQLADPNAQRQASAKARLRQPLADPDLAPVRDPVQLERMPDPDERDKWRSYWADVRKAAEGVGLPLREAAPTPREAK